MIWLQCLIVYAAWVAICHGLVWMIGPGGYYFFGLHKDDPKYLSGKEKDNDVQTNEKECEADERS